MKISHRLAIIIVLTVVEISFSIWVAFELTKGAKFHQLNTLHLNHTAKFAEAMANIKMAHAAVHPDRLMHIVLDIRQQPETCLSIVNSVNEFMMERFGTSGALELCRRDIETADNVLKSLGDYKAGTLHEDQLIADLQIASEEFLSHSTEFEGLIGRTVSAIFNMMIPLVIVISIINILSITYLSRTITGSIADLIRLLREERDGAVEPLEINARVTGELRELMEAAQEHITSGMVKEQVNQQLEAVVAERTLSLQAANEELAQFAYRVSHDLKAPMTTSRGLAQYIALDIDAGDYAEAKANADKIAKQMVKLEELVVGILDLARADLADAQEEVDVAAVINDVLERHQDLFKARNVELVAEVEPGVHFLGVKARISQVLDNLLTNAAKYADAAKAVCRVRVAFRRDADGYVLTVADNGLGIPDVDQPHLFGMFRRFHPDVATGSGLGLSIVKKHIDQMGGEISVTSSSSGTTFTITLPKTTQRQDQHASPTY